MPLWAVGRLRPVVFLGTHWHPACVPWLRVLAEAMLVRCGAGLGGSASCPQSAPHPGRLVVLAPCQHLAGPAPCHPLPNFPGCLASGPLALPSLPVGPGDDCRKSQVFLPALGGVFFQPHQDSRRRSFHYWLHFAGGEKCRQEGARLGEQASIRQQGAAFSLPTNQHPLLPVLSGCPSPPGGPLASPHGSFHQWVALRLGPEHRKSTAARPFLW